MTERNLKIVGVNYILWESPNNKWDIRLYEDRLTSTWMLKVVSYEVADYPLWTPLGISYETGMVPKYVKERVNNFFASLGKFGEVRDLRLFTKYRLFSLQEITAVWNGEENE